MNLGLSHGNPGDPVTVILTARLKSTGKGGGELDVDSVKLQGGTDGNDND
jgi:hypothetical protein